MLSTIFLIYGIISITIYLQFTSCEKNCNLIFKISSISLKNDSVYIKINNWINLLFVLLISAFIQIYHQKEIIFSGKVEKKSKISEYSVLINNLPCYNYSKRELINFLKETWENIYSEKLDFQKVIICYDIVEYVKVLRDIEICENQKSKLLFFYNNNGYFIDDLEIIQINKKLKILSHKILNIQKEISKGFNKRASKYAILLFKTKNSKILLFN